MKNQAQRIALFSRYLAGECSQQEVAQLMGYFNSPDNQDLQDAVLREFESLELIGEVYPALPPRIFQGIKARTFKLSARPLGLRLWQKIAVAASIFLIGSLGFYFYDRSLTDRQDQIAFQNDVSPGRDGATLTLADGKKILIAEALAGNIASESGVKISKTANGQIVYEVSDDGKRADSRLAYNTLSTSRGQQSQVRLPDGSVVFLNAESSLRYPVRFSGAGFREVSLSGEGYFEVAKDKSHPFVVSSAGQTVQVLGTHFNIQAYGEGDGTRTTLIEGAVKVSGLEGESRILKPDQQALLTEQGIEVREVEAAYEIAWKEGFFMFNNERLESIMEKVSRWYNVQVVYQDEELKNRSFIGTINKFENISKVLKMLEATKVASFNVNKGVVNIRKMDKQYVSAASCGLSAMGVK